MATAAKWTKPGTNEVRIYMNNVANTGYGDKVWVAKRDDGGFEVCVRVCEGGNKRKVEASAYSALEDICIAKIGGFAHSMKFEEVLKIA